MTYPLALNLKQRQAPSLKQMQRLIMSPQMQQALNLLQLPIMELSTVLEQEFEQNPVIELEENEEEEWEHTEAEEEWENNSNNIEGELNFEEKSFEILRQLDEEFREHFSESYSQRTIDDEKLQTFLENSIQAEPSLFEYLMDQAKEIFKTPEELKMAELIIGNLSEKGFLDVTLEEIALLNGLELPHLQKILKEIQTFEPYGVGASNVQEALMIQLRCKGLQDTLAYLILKECYDELIHNRIPTIQKELGCTVKEIADAIRQDISKLDLHPGTTCSKEPVRPIVPDVILKLEGDNLEVAMNNDYMPSFRLNRRYLRMLDDESLSIETKNFIKEKIMSAKWLMRNINQRNDTIYRIGEALAIKQKDFFINPNGKLTPMVMKNLAEELEVHESTIARAVAGKYIASPRGVLPLRSFFTNSYLTEKGEDISSQTVREVLKEIISQEDKKKPLSDSLIASKIKAQGIPCARRTVAKYRAELNIGNAHQRKQF